MDTRANEKTRPWTENDFTKTVQFLFVSKDWILFEKINDPPFVRTYQNKYFSANRKASCHWYNIQSLFHIKFIELVDK